MRDTRRTRIVLALLLLSAFTFITLDARGGEGSVLDRAREAASSVLGPIERAAAAVVNPVSDFIDGVTSINSNADIIDALETENDELRRQMLTSDLDQGRVDELNAMLGVPSLAEFTIVPAQVVAVSGENGYARSVTVDAGTRDGVMRDMTVLNGDGLVGRVISAGPTTATVLLLSDPQFTVAARMASANPETGWYDGAGTDPGTLTLLNAQAAVEPGDVIATLGSPRGRPFVPGVLIGEVTEVIATPGALSRQALVAPYADLTSLNIVGIVVEAPRTSRREPIVIPSPTTTAEASPSPSPSPSPTPSP